MEPGEIEIDVELVGNLTFVIDVIVNAVFGTATSKKMNG